jgi:gag-polypeptide of LTR copia-type
MQDHINQLDKIVKQLARIREVMSDKNVAITLLESLPNAYEILKGTLSNGSEAFTYELVKTRALEEEDRLARKDTNGTNENVALASKKKGKDK